MSFRLGNAIDVNSILGMKGLAGILIGNQTRRKGKYEIHAIAGNRKDEINESMDLKIEEGADIKDLVEVEVWGIIITKKTTN